MAATVHREEASEPGRADWRSIFTTLTFVVPEAAIDDLDPARGAEVSSYGSESAASPKSSR